MRARPSERMAATLLYATAVAYACFTLLRYPRWTVDDAYIVFRYAKHLAFQGSLAWNLGAPPVEGYTGIAWPLLVAAGMRAGLAPTSVTFALGVVGLFIALWTLDDNQRKLGVPLLVRAYITSAVTFLPALYAHATSGLETMAFAAALGVSFGGLLGCHASASRGAEVRLWVSLLALSLLRPEGVLFAGVFGAAALAGPKRELARPLRARIALAVALYLVPYGSYFAWRAAHYGRWLPNTYYAKAADAGYNLVFFQDAAHFAHFFVPLIVAVLAAMLAGSGLVGLRARVPPLPALAVLSSLVVLAAIYSRSTLIMGYLFRFQIHYFFALAPWLGAFLASASWISFSRRLGPARGTAIAILIAACLAAWPFESVRAADEFEGYASTYRGVLSEQHAVIGTWLREHLPKSERIALWIDAGIIPYTADEHVSIDFGRLNDRYLAQPRLTRAQIADYFFSSRPGAFVLTEDTWQLGSSFDAAIVTGDPRFAAYERTRDFCRASHPGAPCVRLYLRRGVGEE